MDIHLQIKEIGRRRFSYPIIHAEIHRGIDEKG
eukprot:COSAG02_NODE_6468_length_3553_cov_2.112044_1_plen_32_part_10